MGGAQVNFAPGSLSGNTPRNEGMTVRFSSSNVVRAQIAEDLHRNAHVFLDHRPDGVVAHAPVEQLQRRDAQAFLVDLGRIRRIGARHPAAHIGVVTNGGGKGDAPVFGIQGLKDKDIGQVHAAVERIVHDIHVAGLHLGTVALHHHRQ